VEAQLIITSIVILVFLFVMSVWKFKENPLVYLFKKGFFRYSVSNGIGNAILSLSYVYAPASVITSGKRAFSLLWSIIAGKKYFHEKHILVKIISFTLVIIGLSLLVV
jgi:hypothetical protein